MKLSQKLLALGGVTLADYACCPYDDYGMPHEHCTKALPEKTPFALTDDWRHGACKAWEANVDATFDGNDNECDNGSNTNDNWGSCGFQRHFPWNQINTEVLRNRGCKYGKDANTNAYAQIAGTGCNCEGWGDAELGTIKCVHTKYIADTTTPSATCVEFDPDNQAHQDLDPATYNDPANDVGSVICCNPTLAADAKNDAGTATVGCPERTCETGDEDLFPTTKCWENDILGRRNIQKQSLYIDFTNSGYDDDDNDGINDDDQTNRYDVGNANEASEIKFSYTSMANGVTGSDSNALRYNLAGVPFLGGVCKLFVPVPMSRIVSVQIAGVHVATHKQSVFPAKVDGPSDAVYDSINEEDVGTAYCFSVVNPAEGMRNNGNNVHNGNVAGPSIDAEAGASNIFQDPNYDFNNGNFNTPGAMTSLQRQAGLEPDINFFDGTDENSIGTQMYDATFDADSNTFTPHDSKVGANFDVVVHIHSEWCNSKSFWNYADMQLLGDYGNNDDDSNGNFDYPLNQKFDEDAPIDQRTDTMYSTAQTGPLQLVQLRMDRDQTAVDVTTTADAFTTENDDNWAQDPGNTCYTAAGGVAGCRTAVDTYMTELQAYRQCTTENNCDATAESDFETARNAVAYFDGTNWDDTGCLVDDPSNLIAGCNDLLDADNNANPDGIVDELAGLIAAATAAGNAAGLSTNAIAALALAETNKFTHAHMDLMDKRHNQVASWNNVYQQQDGYLKFPNTGDEAFVNSANAFDQNIYDTAIGGATVSDATYLRWPNAGAFAAFYSFVACANPPYISNPDDDTNPPYANAFSIIYSKAEPVLSASDDANAYAQYGTEALEERTLVMSQSDSDYRDEKCDTRVFRGNLRQVGRAITVCGPGQLPDTDGKRCSWNWNYNAHEAVLNWIKPKDHENDPEEWFDRNDPHSFDMWSTRKRRATPEFANERKYAFNMGYWGTQQGDMGAATKEDGGMFDDEAFDANTEGHAAAIQIPISTYSFNMRFNTAANERVPISTVETNASGCYTTADNCKCRPDYRELNAGITMVNGDGDEITFAADYDSSADAFNTFWGTIDTMGHADCADSDECTSDEMDDIRSNLDPALNENACDFFKPSNEEGYYQPSHRQTLSFDAGLGSNAQVRSALNPSSNEWEVQVFCNNVMSNAVLAGLAETVAQRDRFPDCFFGDELWFTLTYGSGTVADTEPEYNVSHNTYVSSWFSSITYGTAHEYL